jgi:glycerophosphoryl diester phosphodiesterase
MSSLPIRPPIIVHHMAALDHIDAPQNSLEAISASLEAGAAIIEVDITALAVSDYLLVHDPLLESETSGSGPVDKCSAPDSRQLTIKKRGAITSYRVPLLSEVVPLFVNSTARLQLDFKNDRPLDSDEPLYRLVNLIAPLGERVLVSTGADWQLRRLRRIAPNLRLGFDVMGYIDHELPGDGRDPNSFPKRLGAYGYYDDHPLSLARHWPAADYLRDRCESMLGLVPGVSTFYIRHTLLAQSLADGFNWAEALHERGITLDAWTMDVTNPVAVWNAPRLLDAGVDMFTTNTPQALAKLLNGSA